MQFDLLGKAVRRFRLPTSDYNAPIVILPVQEGDVNSRYFDITLYDDNGDVDLSIYSTALLSGSTPSGVVLTSTKCEISEDGKNVIVQFGGGFTAQAGRVACDIMFTNEDRTVSLTSKTFYVIVSESQAGKIITENPEDYNLLLSLLQEVTNLKNDISGAEDDRAAAETARANAEAARAEAETQRNDAESARVSAESARVLAETGRQSQFEDAISDCEDATTAAQNVVDTILETLETLPTATEIQDGSTVNDIVMLRFVKMEGSDE